MMFALILYAYAMGERSSRGIERECSEDVAYRVICANLVPDHVTINRFRSEHQDALGELFGQVLTLSGSLTAEQELAAAGVTDSVEVALADAGFWNTDQIVHLTERGIRTLVNPGSAGRKSPALMRQRKPHYVEMREQLASEEGKQLYGQRMRIIEPVFGQTKHNRRIERFQRTGLAACRAEWKLITATHNLLKLWRHGPTIAGA